MSELTSELRSLLEVAIKEEKYAAADFITKTLRSRTEHPVFGEPVSIKSDPKWLDWMPGHQPMFRDETPAQMMERQAQWPRWRKTIGRLLGVYTP